MSWFAPTPPPLRWVVLDVESSGLDPRRDRLLAVAAVALWLDGPRLALRPADSFEVVLRQPAASADKANILLHGIGLGAQRDGVPPAEGLAAFEDWVGGAPRVGFHVAFDRALLERDARRALDRRLRGPWLDLAALAPVLCPEVRAESLDDWLDAVGITVGQRHQAACDALATAGLLQHLWPRARAQGARDFGALAKLAAARRWIGG